MVIKCHGIRCGPCKGIIGNVLIISSRLQVVRWFELTVLHVVILHSYKSSIGVGLGRACQPHKMKVLP